MKTNETCCLWLPPSSIGYCTPSSEYTDINQHEGNINHPHAFYDRGYFIETKRRGEILGGNWDIADLELKKLLEYVALKNHFLGKEKWRHSHYAERCAKYIFDGYSIDGHNNPKVYIEKREQEIDQLIESIKLDAVKPSSQYINNSMISDDISVNVSREGKVLFNNRGHHRLSIAHILKISAIPVQVIVWHRDFVMKHINLHANMEERASEAFDRI